MMQGACCGLLKQEWQGVCDSFFDNVRRWLVLRIDLDYCKEETGNGCGIMTLCFGELEVGGDMGNRESIQPGTAVRCVRLITDGGESTVVLRTGVSARLLVCTWAWGVSMTGLSRDIT